MDNLLARHRNHIVLLVVLAAQMLGLAIQVRKPATRAQQQAAATAAPSQTQAAIAAADADAESKPVRLIRLWSIALVSPFERMLHSSKTNTGGFWQHYIDLRHTQQQNEYLQKDIDRLRLEQAELLEDARQGQRLQAMLGFQKKYVYKTEIAQVIGTSGTEQSRVYILDKGADAGLKPEMAVITPGGIVGKIREVYQHTSQMLAVNDQTSGAGVILTTTRIRGILRGNASGQLMVTDLLADQRIKAGEQVVTAGGDQIFPRGLPVGVVEKVVPDPVRDAFVDVILKPTADIHSLDEVMIITDTNAAMPPVEQRDLSESESEKGAEAAEIAARQKAAAINAERLPSLHDNNAATPVTSIVKPGETAPPPPPTDAAMPHILPAQHQDRFSAQPTVTVHPKTTEPETAKPAAKPETPKKDDDNQ